MEQESTYLPRKHLQHKPGLPPRFGDLLALSCLGAVLDIHIKEAKLLVAMEDLAVFGNPYCGVPNLLGALQTRLVDPSSDCYFCSLLLLVGDLLHTHFVGQLLQGILFPLGVTDVVGCF